jgi:hypothetical protein
MSEFSYIKPVILNLISKDEYKLAFQLLDFYRDKAKTLSDFDVLGELALKSEHRDLYLFCAKTAYSMANTNEQLFASRTNLYKALSALNYPEEALFYIDLNLKIKPDDFELKLNRAFNLSLMNKKEESEQIIDSLIDNGTKKQKDDIRFALSGRMLRNGETAKGILNFIDTFKPKNHTFEVMFKMEKWTGQEVKPGTKIYVCGEGGIGDEIINIRFLDNLKEKGFNPILYSSWSKYRPDTVDLFIRHGYNVITDTYSIDRTAMWTNMMPLPGYLNLKEEELWRNPYLYPLKQEKNKVHSQKIKVGIKNSGNPYFSQDEYRKIDLDTLVSFIPENCEIYFIDKKEVNHPRVNNLCNRIDSWEDTLDFIEQMDVIISSCTSLVHASGAIGKRTIVIVPITEYYVWTSTRTNNTTPWYGDNFTVLKQTKVRSWIEPLQQMNKILNERT